ncbi:MAG TPA: hypothetical protein VGI39_34175 [Polyangiaceae bacterium]|jgi:hypothetical protein
MPLRTLTGASVAVVLFAGLAGPARADDPPSPPPPPAVSKDECVAAYRNAQILRLSGKLVESLAQLSTCARSECPELLRNDCVPWLGEVARSVPSVVFQARTERGDEQEVHVLLDGVLLVERLDGKSVKVDPGPHVFRFELQGRPPVEESLVIGEGQKDRVVTASWETPHAPGIDTVPPLPLPPDRSTTTPARPIPVPAYVAGGAGVLGLAGFATFGLLGVAKKNDLKNSCAPVCTDAQLGPSKTYFALADASLAVGVVGLTVGAVLFFTRPEVPVTKANVVVDVGPRGAAVGWRGEF